MIPHLLFMLLFCHLKIFHCFSFYCLKSNIMSSFMTHIIIRKSYRSRFSKFLEHIFARGDSGHVYNLAGISEVTVSFHASI